MADSQHKLLYLFEQPSEPLTKPRGQGSFAFSFDELETEVTGNRFGVSPVKKVNVPERPDAHPGRLGSATSVPRGSPFSLFLQPHRQAAKDLANVFMKTQGAEDLMELAARVQGQVNEGLYIYALSFTILHKKELRGNLLPNLTEVFPDKFIPQDDLMKAYLQARDIAPAKKTLSIKHEPDFSGTTVKAEHRVSYWREDFGINNHHWHWHLAYPLNMGVKRDRKGELFYYMHQQMLARYDMERLSVGLNRVQELESWRVPIPDGYFPKLTVNNSGRAWGSRQDNTLLKDYRRGDFGADFIDITDLEIWHSRLLEAIHKGFVVDRKGDRIFLSDDVSSGKRGIDILGDAVEADSDLSVNFPYYGNLHNMGHNVISVAHDPDFAHKEEMSVMADTGTAMRDPVFYLWHKFVDGIFQEYKLTLPPYTKEYLSLPGVVLDNATVVSYNETLLTTGWNIREFEADRGLDFNSPVPVVLQVTHLDHHPFNYHLQVTNSQGPKQVTVRIFLAPKHNIRGVEMTFLEQRLLWAEMDKFTILLKAGKNHIVHSSRDSSISRPPELTFRELEESSDSDSERGFCGCGWPQHLLLPRGKPAGMDFQFFFMLTDWEEDKVESPEDPKTCASAVSFCGILDAKYPDTRPMGFPFDRRPPAHLMDPSFPKTSDLAKLDNVMLYDVKITFLNKGLEEKQDVGDGVPRRPREFTII